MSQIVQAAYAKNSEDEIAGLKLHMEDIGEREESKKAKYPMNNPPDLEIAYGIYLAELRNYLQIWTDLKLAHSIANAVDSDAQVIAELSQAETQDEEDRQVAIRMSHGDPGFEAPPPYTEEAHESSVKAELARRLADMLISNEDNENDAAPVAGPSQPYVHQQADALGKMAREAFKCTACMDNFRMADVLQLQCDHEYCRPCLKEVIMHGVKNHDIALLPPRCCGKPVAHEVIVNILSAEEMEDFRNAVTEKDTRDKTYCSNMECGNFIAPTHIFAGNASCPRCKSQTCAMCKGGSHEDDCPADPALQATLELGTENRWQRCFSCRSLVAIEWGCNHMTYVLL